MPIETNMGIKEVLNSYETRNWVQSTRVEGVQNKLKISDAPNVKLESFEHKSFVDFLGNSIKRVNDLQNDANLAMEKLASGKTKNIHEAMMIVEQAEIAFKTMNQIRSKVIDSYREVMRMQI